MATTERAYSVDHVNATARNADLREIFTLLQEQAARRVDLVAPAATVMSWKGNIHVKGADPVLTEDGVSTADGVYRPNTVALEGLADKTGVPIKYLRTLHADRTDLFDALVNGHLRGGIDKEHLVAEADHRSFLLRTFKPTTNDGNDGTPGIMRAVLSDRYKVIDNLDTAVSVMEGLQAAGLDPSNIQIQGDLTERRMRLRVTVPEIQALAPTLMRGYRSPYSGQTGDENPTVFAGFEFGNSEVGNGAWSITPRMVFQICTNGMTIAKDAVRNVHLGSKLDAGVVRWSETTQQKNLELVKSQTVDAVRTFLDVEFMKQVIAQAEAKAEQSVTTEQQVRDVTKGTAVTQNQIESIMGFFVQGGQANRAGVFNAITAFAQTVEDGDTAADLEEAAMKVLVA